MRCQWHHKVHLIFNPRLLLSVRRTRWNPVTTYEHLTIRRIFNTRSLCVLKMHLNAINTIPYEHFTWSITVIDYGRLAIYLFTHHMCTCNYAKKKERKTQSTNMSTDSYTRKMSSCGRLVIWIYNSRHACAIIPSFKWNLCNSVELQNVHSQTSCTLQCCGYCTKPKLTFSRAPSYCLGAPHTLHSLYRCAHPHRMFASAHPRIKLKMCPLQCIYSVCCVHNS